MDALKKVSHLKSLKARFKKILPDQQQKSADESSMSSGSSSDGKKKSVRPNMSMKKKKKKNKKNKKMNENENKMMMMKAKKSTSSSSSSDRKEKSPDEVKAKKRASTSSDSSSVGKRRKIASKSKKKVQIVESDEIPPSSPSNKILSEPRMSVSSHKELWSTTLSPTSSTETTSATARPLLHGFNLNNSSSAPPSPGRLSKMTNKVSNEIDPLESFQNQTDAMFGRLKGRSTEQLQRSSSNKRMQSAQLDEETGLWRCRHCNWIYPNPNPSARHRRDHKKHCREMLNVQQWLGLGVSGGQDIEGAVVEGVGELELHADVEDQRQDSEQQYTELEDILGEVDQGNEGLNTHDENKSEGSGSGNFLEGNTEVTHILEGGSESQVRQLGGDDNREGGGDTGLRSEEHSETILSEAEEERTEVEKVEECPSKDVLVNERHTKSQYIEEMLVEQVMEVVADEGSHSLPAPVLNDQLEVKSKENPGKSNDEGDKAEEPSEVKSSEGVVMEDDKVEGCNSMETLAEIQTTPLYIVETLMDAVEAKEGSQSLATPVLNDGMNVDSNETPRKGKDKVEQLNGTFPKLLSEDLKLGSSEDVEEKLDIGDAEPVFNEEDTKDFQDVHASVDEKIEEKENVQLYGDHARDLHMNDNGHNKRGLEAFKENEMMEANTPELNVLTEVREGLVNNAVGGIQNMMKKLGQEMANDNHTSQIVEPDMRLGVHDERIKDKEVSSPSPSSSTGGGNHVSELQKVKTIFKDKIGVLQGLGSQFGEAALSNGGSRVKAVNGELKGGMKSGMGVVSHSDRGNGRGESARSDNLTSSMGNGNGEGYNSVTQNGKESEEMLHHGASVLKPPVQLASSHQSPFSLPETKLIKHVQSSTSVNDGKNTEETITAYTSRLVHKSSQSDPVNFAVHSTGEGTSYGEGEARKSRTVVEYEVERVIQEQETHDLLCPACGSCITKRVILRKRKRTVTEVYEEDPPPEKADIELDSWGCFACFSIFFRRGDKEVPTTSPAQDSQVEERVYCLPLFFPAFPWGPNDVVSREVLPHDPGLQQPLLDKSGLCPPQPQDSSDDQAPVESQDSDQEKINCLPLLLPTFSWGPATEIQLNDSSTAGQGDLKDISATQAEQLLRIEEALTIPEETPPVKIYEEPNRPLDPPKVKSSLKALANSLKSPPQQVSQVGIISIAPGQPISHINIVSLDRGLAPETQPIPATNTVPKDEPPVQHGGIGNLVEDPLHEEHGNEGGHCLPLCLPTFPWGPSDTESQMPATTKLLTETGIPKPELPGSSLTNEQRLRREQSLTVHMLSLMLQEYPKFEPKSVENRFRQPHPKPGTKPQVKAPSHIAPPAEPVPVGTPREKENYNCIPNLLPEFSWGPAVSDAAELRRPLLSEGAKQSEENSCASFIDLMLPSFAWNAASADRSPQDVAPNDMTGVATDVLLPKSPPTLNQDTVSDNLPAISSKGPSKKTARDVPYVKPPTGPAQETKQEKMPSEDPKRSSRETVSAMSYVVGHFVNTQRKVHYKKDPETDDEIIDCIEIHKTVTHFQDDCQEDEVVSSEEYTTPGHPSGQIPDPPQKNNKEIEEILPVHPSTHQQVPSIQRPVGSIPDKDKESETCACIPLNLPSLTWQWPLMMGGTEDSGENLPISELPEQGGTSIFPDEPSAIRSSSWMPSLLPVPSFRWSSPGTKDELRKPLMPEIGPIDGTETPLPPRVVTREIKDIRINVANDNLSVVRHEEAIVSIDGLPVPGAVAESVEQGYLKSLVYGGLDESLISLGVVCSSAGADAKTATVLAMGLANVVFGVLTLIQTMTTLYYEDRQKFQATVGRSLRLNGFLACVSFIFFGFLAPITFGFSFRHETNRDYKFVATCAVALVSLLLLGAAKARVTGRSALRIIASLVATGFLAAIAGYQIGNYGEWFIEQCGFISN